MNVQFIEAEYARCGICGKVYSPAMKDEAERCCRDEPPGFAVFMDSYHAAYKEPTYRKHIALQAWNAATVLNQSKNDSILHDIRFALHIAQQLAIGAQKREAKAIASLRYLEEVACMDGTQTAVKDGLPVKWPCMVKLGELLKSHEGALNFAKAIGDAWQALGDVAPHVLDDEEDSLADAIHKLKN